MSEEEKKDESAQETPPEQLIPWATFLEEYPLDTKQFVSDYYSMERGDYGNVYKVRQTPVLRLYCAHCDGIRNFSGKWERQEKIHDPREAVVDDFLIYTCHDCREYQKRYCLFSGPYDDKGNGIAVKAGEFPELDIAIPSTLPKLFGEDYPYFIKGLKCEKKGLGVGAYVYYRRVVENQKNRMLEAILRVAQKLGAKPEVIQALDEATRETQFGRAVDKVKGILPESLLVDGHNPFTLIHKALSIGIHNETDETCLTLAHSVRMVLTDLSERIKSALSEQKEIQSAVSSLMKFNQEHS